MLSSHSLSVTSAECPRSSRFASIRIPEGIPGIRFDNSQSIADIPYIQGDEKNKSVNFIYDKNQNTTTIISVGPEKLCMEKNTILKGSSRTRGHAVFSGDGKGKNFKVVFETPFVEESPPCIVYSDNQFERSRLAQTDKWSFTVEYENPPPAGNDNILINWMAQE